MTHPNNTYKDPAYPYMHNLMFDPRLLGFPAVLNPFAQNTSSPRGDMFSSQIHQSLVVKNPEFPQVYTGFESELRHYEMNGSERRQDVQVLAVIPKYSTMVTELSVHRNPTITVVCLGLDDHKIHYFTIDSHFKGSDGFGFQWIHHHKHLLTEGTYIPKDVVLQHSPAVNGSKYMMGVNVNTVYMDHPGVLEDAMVISESLAKKLETQGIHSMTLNVNPNQYPVNLFGDEDVYKFLPDIGEKVGEDGVLCAFRPIDLTYFPSDTYGKRMRELQCFHDVIYRVPPGSEVLDITFYRNVAREQISWQVFSQMEKYSYGIQKYYERIVDVYKRYRKRYECSPEFSTLVTEAITRLSAMNVKVPGVPFKGKTRLLNRIDQPIELMQIDITYGYTRECGRAYKISDRFSAKGVICDILPDEDMPTDDFGIRADLIIDRTTCVRRMNTGQLNEQLLNRTSEFVRRRVADLYKDNPHQAALTLLEYYHDVNENYASLVRSTYPTEQELIQHTAEVIRDRIYLNIPPFLQNTYDMGEDSENPQYLKFFTDLAEKWGMQISPVTHAIRDEVTGERIVFRTETPVLIGEKYSYLLCKIPEVFTVGVGRVSHHGFPIKPGAEIRKQSVVSETPVRFGEDEIRLHSMDIDTEEVYRIMTLQAESIRGVETAVHHLMMFDNSTAIDRIPISNQELKDTDSASLLFHHIMNVIGIDARNTGFRPEDILEDPVFRERFNMDEGSDDDPIEDD